MFRQLDNVLDGAELAQLQVMLARAAFPHTRALGDTPALAITHADSIEPAPPEP